MKPADVVASNTQSMAPDPSTIEQALFPLDGDETVNLGSSAGDRTVSVKFLATPRWFACSSTCVSTGTVAVSTMKVAVFWPAGTVTLEGTFAASALLVSN